MKFYGKVFDNEKIASTESMNVDGTVHVTQSAFSLTTAVSVVTENSSDLSRSEPEVLNLHSVNTTMRTTTEEVFSFLPLETTTQKSSDLSAVTVENSFLTSNIYKPIDFTTTIESPKIDLLILTQNVNTTSQYLNESLITTTANQFTKPTTTTEEVFTFIALVTTTTHKPEDVVISSATESPRVDFTNNPTTTDFFSENPKNVLLTSTENIASTVHNYVTTIDHSSTRPIEIKDELFNGTSKASTEFPFIANASSDGLTLNPVFTTTPTTIGNISEHPSFESSVTSQTEASFLSTTDGKTNKNETNYDMTTVMSTNDLLITEYLSTKTVTESNESIMDKDLKEPASTTEKPLDSNEIDETIKSELKTSTLKPAQASSNDSNDDTENDESNVLATEDIEVATNRLVNDDDLSTRSILVSMLMTSTESNLIPTSTRNTNTEIVKKSSESQETDEKNFTVTSITQSENTSQANDHNSSVENDYLHDRNDSSSVNSTRKPRLRNFFYYYFITAIKANESRARELNKTLEEEEIAKQEFFLGLPGDQSSVEHQISTVWH